MFTCLGEEAREAGSVRNRLGSMSPSCAGDSMPGSFYFAVLSRLPFHAGGSRGISRGSRAWWNVYTAACWTFLASAWNLTQPERLIRQHPGYECFQPRAIFSAASCTYTRGSTVRNGIGLSVPPADSGCYDREHGGVPPLKRGNVSGVIGLEIANSSKINKKVITPFSIKFFSIW